jgi:hypothetical protein
MAQGTSTQPQQPTSRVEEKFFQLPPREAEPLIQAAVEAAAGTTMTELTPGMWMGHRVVSDEYQLEITASTIPTDDGTSVQLNVEHKPRSSSMLLSALKLVLFIVTLPLIVPLIFLVIQSQKQQLKHQQERKVMVHRIWREIAEAIGAPKRASYRQTPKRVYVPQNPVLDDAELEAAATEEALEEEARSARARRGSAN